MSAQQQPIAQRTPLLIGDDERVLSIPGRMSGREIHTLEVVEVGLNLGPYADRVAQRGEDAGNLVQSFSDWVLSPDKPQRAGKRNVDDVGGKCSIIRARANGLIE